ncbi:aliphatic sulfonate ABC transporter substrate-binding protein [Jiangella aurantiaca]|uniref:Aliphatic sulfonate ABC transporter substrate-binding protein n=1 Tax=Jiangella aurantiaca TaxID=2530373 RepID=A0A4R5A9D2_9ACTN|nr:aliphatic sulfonate ABC transporter substrate-binding protein [Jiangella aurantiaca]TDD68918.1 aliphatic sulfonate ABC transporter substrate-binding protein [Jiangella aurantiaca]
MIMRRSVFALAAVAAVALAGCSGDSESSDDQAMAGGRESVELNVGYIDTSINGVGVIAVANELELWEKAGIDVNLTPFTNGPTQVEAMAAGSLDVGYMGAGATWMPASGQAVIVAPSEATYGDFLIASPDSGAQSVEDIEGLRVGVPVGGSGEMILSLALDAAGLTEDDIEKVPLDPPAVVSAFVSGQIDVAAIFSPLSDQIMQSVPEAVVIANNKDFPDVTFLGAWVASNQAMEGKQEAVERFLEVYIEANDYRKENPEETVELAAAESGAPAEQLQGQVDALEWFTSDQLLADNEDGTTRERFGALQDLFVELGRMESPRPVEEWVDVDLFAQAAESLS